MKSTVICFALFCLHCLGATPGSARNTAIAVDDTGTVVRSPNLQLQWPRFVPRQASSGLQGSTTVDVRLNVAAWKGHNVRIYMLIPNGPAGPVRAAWTTHGRLLPGALSAGTARALVYAGPITAARLEDVLELSLVVSGAHLQQACPLDFRFEMESS
jgi:hypothetical protein